MAESDLDFAIDEINREQTRWNYMEAELNAAEKHIVELEAALKQQTAYCKKCCRDNKYSPQLVAAEKKVQELEKALIPLAYAKPTRYHKVDTNYTPHVVSDTAVNRARAALNK